MGLPWVSYKFPRGFPAGLHGLGLFLGQMGAGKLAKVLFVASLLASQSAAEWRSG